MLTSKPTTLVTPESTAKADVAQTTMDLRELNLREQKPPTSRGCAEKQDWNRGVSDCRPNILMTRKIGDNIPKAQMRTCNLTTGTVAATHVQVR